MVEHELLGYLIKYWDKSYITNKKFDFTLYESMYDDVLIIEEGSKMLLPIEPSRNFLDQLMIYSGNVIHFLYIINTLYAHTKYLLRRNKINTHLIYCDFNAQNNFIQHYDDIIPLMFQINQKIPMKKDVSDSIKQAYKVIDQFKKHGHYLPNLSKNNTGHKVNDVLLYLRLVHTHGFKIYDMAIDPIRRKIDYKYIFPDEY